MDGQAAFDRIPAQAPPGAGGEQRISGEPTPFGQPDAQDVLRRLRQGNRPLLAAFALATHARAGAEGDVAAVQPHKLRDAQAGLHGNHEQGAVSSSLPAAAIGGSEKRTDFITGEERLQRWGDRAHGSTAQEAVSRRPAARASSSGAAERYQ